MPHIIFFCPPVSVINGGIRHIFRMAEVLRKAGHDAVIFEQKAERPTWFSSDVPVVGQDVLNPAEDQVYVLPEDQPHILRDFTAFPRKKVIYAQNHFYGALGIGEKQSYADYDISHLLCSSRTIYEHSRMRHASIRASVIPCAVDRDLFRPAPSKRNAIAFMPRKRKIEATYIRDMFRFTYPECRDWDWIELSDKSEVDVARAFGEAKVFLSLSRLEGFGLAPLEAMSADCIVAGFTGIGGREYANPHNGLWAAEDDFPTCVALLKRAVELASGAPDVRRAYADACHETLAAYTTASFRGAVEKAWAEILG